MAEYIEPGCTGLTVPTKHFSMYFRYISYFWWQEESSFLFFSGFGRKKYRVLLCCAGIQRHSSFKIQRRYTTPDDFLWKLKKLNINTKYECAEETGAHSAANTTLHYAPYNNIRYLEGWVTEMTQHNIACCWLPWLVATIRNTEACNCAPS